jgi:hypothetical protein
VENAPGDAGGAKPSDEGGGAVKPHSPDHRDEASVPVLVIVGDPATSAYDLIASRYKDFDEFTRRRVAFADYFGIKEDFYCINFVGGYIRTGEDHIYSINNETGEDAADIVSLLEDAQRVEREVQWSLDGNELAAERSTCIEMVAWVFGSAFALLDDTQPIEDSQQKKEARSASARAYQLPKGQLEYADSYYERVAQRTAQIRYFRGLTIGAAAILGAGLLLALLLATFFPLLELSPSPLAPIVVSLFGGAAGAVVSVMSRMSFGQLALDLSAERSQIVRLGAFRPLIGSIFGAALIMLIHGGLLPIAGPADATRQLYFYAGVAFLAGFSERWAQDMLSGTANRISGATRDTKERSQGKEGGKQVGRD